VDWDDVLLANAAATNWTGDYNGIQTHGRDFYGTLATDNTPDLANFPYGVRYQRNVNFATKQLFDLTNTVVIPSSIDPFFFTISWHEEEGEEEEGEFGFKRLEIEGLHYEKLSIKKLKLERLRRNEEDDEDDADEGKESRAIARLLGRILSDTDHDEEDD
jgi:hypothetical protein